MYYYTYTTLIIPARMDDPGHITLAIVNQLYNVGATKQDP